MLTHLCATLSFARNHPVQPSDAPSSQPTSEKPRRTPSIDINQEQLPITSREEHDASLPEDAFTAEYPYSRPSLIAWLGHQTPENDIFHLGPEAFD